MQFIRIEEHKDTELLSIYEFEGGMEKAQVFRLSTGTCTRIFSKILRECLERGNVVTIYKGGGKA
jgi:hypothetical protein